MRDWQSETSFSREWVNLISFRMEVNPIYRNMNSHQRASVSSEKTLKLGVLTEWRNVMKMISFSSAHNWYSLHWVKGYSWNFSGILVFIFASLKTKTKTKRTCLKLISEMETAKYIVKISEYNKDLRKKRWKFNGVFMNTDGVFFSCTTNVFSLSSLALNV